MKNEIYLYIYLIISFALDFLNTTNYLIYDYLKFEF